MSESIKTEQFNNLPESKIKPRSKFSIVWLVPIIAILIGSWLAYKAWSEMGPEISITFKTADGLEAGKTKIKYKNVEIGVITTIEINPDTHEIEAKAEMEKNIAPFLTDKTSFWVVTARVTSSGVSGLGTLLSGAYINVDPSIEGKKSRKFTGLEIPPVISSEVSGKRFILHSKSLGSITRDAPVFYRKFSVGRVEEVKLNDDGQSATVNIFINAPYD
ncbi:MAG: MCE family protein, partial [Thiotrichaceae bacterium]|nr:MCE family protein [Thiotrichaceae bacterium]